MTGEFGRMQAWCVRRLGDPLDALAVENVPAPTASPGIVVVEVDACGLNFSDVLLCRGDYQEHPDLPFILGTEIAGTVVEAAADSRHMTGTRVMARTGPPSGGLAEYAAVETARSFAIPDSLDDASAAALHVTYQTAWFALHHRAQVTSGETVLVHAGAGGTGSAAIQLATAAGARVLATAGGSAKVGLCRELGAEVAIDYRSDDVVASVLEATGGDGADVIVDPVGGDTFDASRRCVAFEGRLVVVGFAGGRIVDAPTHHLFVKNYSVLGLHWPLYEVRRPELVRRVHDELMALHADGRLRPVVGAVRPFEEAAEALDDLANRRTTGKVVIRT